LLDCANLAEELEAMAADQRRELRNHLRKLLLHLLKLKTRPSEMHLHNSWRVSIREARHDIEDLLEIAPGIFQGKQEEVMSVCYARARALAGDATGLGVRAFPAECPWSFDQVMKSDFFPGVSRS
jgi:hypothetical protein